MSGGLHPAATAFGMIAELYERARPSYPGEAVEWLAARLGLGQGRVVADVAAGTGKLTRDLVASGARVVAVEPLEEMRAVLARVVPEAQVLDGRAEELPFGDAAVDAVTVGQAFHWFDAQAALRELGRVIRPGGALALLWNVRDPADAAQSRIQALLREVRAGAPSENERPWRAHAAASPHFGDVEERTFMWETEYTREQYAERLSSVSVVAALAEPERTRLLERVDEALAPEPDPLPVRYRTEVYVLPRV